MTIDTDLATGNFPYRQPDSIHVSPFITNHAELGVMVVFNIDDVLVGYQLSTAAARYLADELNRRLDPGMGGGIDDGNG